MAVFPTMITTLFPMAFAGNSPAVPMDDLIKFAEPSRCIPSKEFDALLNGTIRWQASGDTYGGELASPPVPTRFRSHLGIPALKIVGNEYRATLPVNGTWQGLKLHSLVIVNFVESESGFYLVFDASPQEVLDAANMSGFKIPPLGSESREEGVMSIHMGVEAYEGRAALYCFVG